MIIRSASGIVFLALMTTGILYHPISFGVLMSVIMAGCLSEFYNLTSGKREAVNFQFSKKNFVILSSLGVFWMSYVLCSDPVRAFPDINNPAKALVQVLLMQRDSSLPLNALLPMLIFLFFVIELYTRSENPFANIGWNVLAVVYIVLPFVLTTKIYFEKGGYFILALFSIIWLYDSACYGFGSLLGKRKLFERISPKKTIEGTIGGVLFTMATLYFVTNLPGLQFLFGKLSRWEWLITGFVLIVMATYGDLVESLLKRSVGVKDSGNLMPGHGGFLDRFDAYLLTVPFISFLLWAFTQADNLRLLIDYVK